MKNLIVTVQGLNLRDKSGLDGDIIDVLNKGDVVELLGSSIDGYWMNIKIAGKTGWASHKYLLAKTKELPPEIASVPKSSFPWFDIAIQEIGTKEVPGDGDAPRVVEYLRSTNLSHTDSSNDETPWCSAFVNWCVEKSGNAGTDSAWARSWLNWGKKTENPVTGCPVVFTRGDNAGHVAFFVSKTDTHVKVLGGNQSDMVCITDYPIGRLLGYRVPK